MSWMSVMAWEDRMLFNELPLDEMDGWALETEIAYSEVEEPKSVAEDRQRFEGWLSNQGRIV